MLRINEFLLLKKIKKLRNLQQISLDLNTHPLAQKPYQQMYQQNLFIYLFIDLLIY